MGKTTELLNEALMNGKRYLRAENKGIPLAKPDVSNPHTTSQNKAGFNCKTEPTGATKANQIDLEDLLEKKKPRLIKKLYNQANANGEGPYQLAQGKSVGQNSAAASNYANEKNEQSGTINPSKKEASGAPEGSSSANGGASKPLDGPKTVKESSNNN